MSTTSIGDVKGRIAAANQKGSEAINGVSGVIASLEAQRAALRAATDGSPQADVSGMVGAINRAIDHLDKGRGLIAGAIHAAEDVAARL